MKLTDIKAGDIIMADAGFTCLNSGHHVVEESRLGLYIRCDHGEHYLAGQEDEGGELVGISAAATRHQGEDVDGEGKIGRRVLSPRQGIW